MQLSERPIKSLKNIEGIQIHLKYENRRFPFVTTSSPGRFSLALGAGREKALASAGHMTTKHPVFVGVIN